MTSPIIKIDPKLDLVLERDIDVPVELVWRAWTTPEHLREWFAPRPWTITACDLDLRPGGAINFTMRSPEGEEYPNTQCYLEVKPFERLILTDTLQGGYRPSANPFFTAVLELAKNGNGTRYKAIAIHGDEAARKKHEEMASTRAGARWPPKWWRTSRRGGYGSDEQVHRFNALTTSSPTAHGRVLAGDHLPLTARGYRIRTINTSSVYPVALFSARGSMP